MSVQLLRRFVAFSVAVIIVVNLFVVQPQRVKSLTYISGSLTADCSGVGFVNFTANFDRNNIPTPGYEQYAYRAVDGAGNVLYDPGYGFLPVPFGVVLFAGGIGFTPYTTPPTFNPITVTMVSLAGNGLPEQVIYATTGTCPGLPFASGGEKHFDPKDSRIDGRPGDRLVVYCNQPDTIVVYGVDNSGKGFELTTFSNQAVRTAGSQGMTKSFGSNGTVSISSDSKGNFWLAWNGGPYGNFSKGFSCNFPNPNPPTQPPTSVDRPTLEATTTLNVRSGPSAGAGKVGQISPGTNYRVIGKNSNGIWLQIEYNGIIGWVCSSFTKNNGLLFLTPVTDQSRSDCSTPTTTNPQPPQSPGITGDQPLTQYPMRVNTNPRNFPSGQNNYAGWCAKFARDYRLEQIPLAGPQGAKAWLTNADVASIRYRLSSDKVNGDLRQSGLQPGHIIVWGAGQLGANAQYGHAAVITKVFKDSVEIVESDWGYASNRQSPHTRTLSRGTLAQLTFLGH
jgi:hypothetical protein